MGCTSSVLSHNSSTPPVVKRYSFGRTRIVQEEEVDVFTDDEYDVVTSDWEEGPSGFQEQNVLLEAVGSWKRDTSAGGSRNDLELFSTNPQFLLTLGPPDKHPKDDDFYIPDPNLSAIEVFVCLTQTNFTAPPLHVAFFIYKTDSMEERLCAEYFLCMPAEGDTGSFVNWRQVKQQFKLTPGLYVIIPATFRAGLEGIFKLSVKTVPPASLLRMTSHKSLFQSTSSRIRQKNVNYLPRSVKKELDNSSTHI